jgi:arylsulfatase A-like enzyme
MTSDMSKVGPETPGKPNVVLVNCDDLGYGDLGCYGSTLNKTPTLDRLAAEGLRFTDFYMASPVCSPSRGAMLTGCYPPRIGFGQFDGLPVLFPGQSVGLAPSEISLGRLLSTVGYRTALVGKWHCGDQPPFLPTNHGFDHYFGLPYSNDMGRQVAGDFDIPMDYPPLPLMLDEGVLEQQPDQAALTERYVDEAIRFMRASADEPFFLYFAHMYVHLPIYVQERFARQSSNGTYGAAVEAIDWATDAVLHELDALGVAENTIVIFTSDNGSLARDGGSNHPLRGAKGTTWEGGMRVPCIVRWPARITPGRTSSELATAMDFYPTLATVCGAELPTDRTIDGRDLSAVWFDSETSSPHDAFFYYQGDDLDAVRSGRWKLRFWDRYRPSHDEIAEAVRAGTFDLEQLAPRVAVRELYDLEHDPSETTDVYDRVHTEEPSIIDALDAHAERARASIGDASTGRSGADVRAAGRVETPKPLTTFDPAHPYYMAEYDLSERG